MCGENDESAAAFTDAVGSPPRVRGKRFNADRIGTITRITPACAGKTSLGFMPVMARADHPRVCGENLTLPFGSTFVSGSPPRVRGKHLERCDAAVHNRITPACAGKTRSSSRYCSTAADHPRVCGENYVNLVVGRKDLGSPPRVRGKRE